MQLKDSHSCTMLNESLDHGRVPRWPIPRVLLIFCLVGMAQMSNADFKHSLISLSNEHDRALTLGSRVFFAGGDSDVVDMFDFATGKWDIASLSQARFKMATAAVSSKALFAAGGVGFVLYNTVDVYDSATNAWSTTR